MIHEHRIKFNGAVYACIVNGCGFTKVIKNEPIIRVERIIQNYSGLMRQPNFSF